MLAILRDDAPVLAPVQKVAAELRRRRESLEDDSRSGCPETATTEENNDCVMDDRRLTVNQITNVICISCKRIENFLNCELGMMKLSAHWVPHLLIPDQKCTRLITWQKSLEKFETDPTNV